MIRRQRALHLGIWCGLAILLPAALVFALLTRQDPAIEPQVIQRLPTSSVPAPAEMQADEADR